MTQTNPLSIPTSIGSIELIADEVLAFSPDERGGIRIILKEEIEGMNPEIISGYPYHDFKSWFDTNC